MGIALGVPHLAACTEMWPVYRLQLEVCSMGSAPKLCLGLEYINHLIHYFPPAVQSNWYNDMNCVSMTRTTYMPCIRLCNIHMSAQCRAMRCVCCCEKYKAEVALLTYALCRAVLCCAVLCSEEYKAEVALLTRRILFTSDATSTSTGIGAQAFVYCQHTRLGRTCIV